jgi:GAF domain-containing protein/HAMP domain-containing protein
MMDNHSSIQSNTSPLGERQRKDAFRRMLVILVSAAGMTIVFYALLFWQTHIWQLWIEAGSLAIAIGLAFLSKYYLDRDQSELAGIWVLVGIAIAFAGNELAWSGATWYIAIGGILMIWLIGRIVLPDKYKIWMGTSLLFSAVIAILAWLQPLHRFNISSSAILSFFIPGLTISLVLIFLWQLAQTVQANSIRYRLLVGFIFITILPVFITGLISNVISSRNIEERLVNQLESVATLKEAEINAWMNSLDLNLTNLLSRQEVKRSITNVMQQNAIPEAEFHFSHDELQKQFSEALGRTQLFDEIFVMNLNGKVIVSTDPSQEEKVFFGQPLFDEGLKGSLIAPPLYAPSLQNYRIVASQPLYTADGILIGVIAARSKLERLDTIMLERAGLGQTGETYLVGSNNVLVTVLRSGQRYLNMRTQGVLDVLGSHSNGSGTYVNVLGENVIGVYHWIPKLQVALMAEQGQNEALQSLSTTLRVNIAVTAIALLLAIVLSMLITRGIANPIAELARTASEIAAGKLGLTANVKGKDEISALAKAFNSMALQLRDFIGSLEQRVDERTLELERRSNQIQAAAEVARDITSTTNLSEVMDQAVNLIRDRFNFYHAGIFLVDERGEYAVLQAATGLAGKQLLAQGHRLKVGAVGIVGSATGSGKPHIALDVGADATHFKNPLLPETRSEMALPLQVGGRVIGALDVQSQEAAAFDEDDVTILQTMADQLAIAIENARLIQRMNQALDELEQAYGHYTQNAWQNFTQDPHRIKGYRYQHLNVQPADTPRPEAEEALKKGEIVWKSYPHNDSQPASSISGNAAESKGEISGVAVPIRLRGQVIGVLNLRFQSESVPKETIALIEEAASRLALVLENSRLLEEAQQKASREQFIGQVAARVRETLDINTVLKTAIREIGSALDVSEIEVRMGKIPGMD